MSGGAENLSRRDMMRLGASGVDASTRSGSSGTSDTNGTPGMTSTSNGHGGKAPP